jgi:hypothetical protein
MEFTTETTEMYPEFPQYLKIWQNYLYCTVPNLRKKRKSIEGKREENNHFSIHQTVTSPFSKQSLLHSANNHFAIQQTITSLFSKQQLRLSANNHFSIQQTITSPFSTTQPR